MFRTKVDMRSDLEWSAVDGLSTCSCSSGISPLNDELTHNSVKYCSIIVTSREEKYYKSGNNLAYRPVISDPFLLISKEFPGNNSEKVQGKQKQYSAGTFPLI